MGMTSCLLGEAALTKGTEPRIVQQKQGRADVLGSLCHAVSMQDAGEWAKGTKDPLHRAQLVSAEAPPEPGQLVSISLQGHRPAPQLWECLPATQPVPASSAL